MKYTKESINNIKAAVNRLKKFIYYVALIESFDKIKGNQKKINRIS
jgi:hypothetical protein